MLSDIENFLVTPKVNLSVGPEKQDKDPKDKRQDFVKFRGSKGEELFVRKSSCLWAWERNKKRVSTDRIFRFFNDKKNVTPTADSGFLLIGDYACFNNNEEIIIGHVLGFVYLSGNRTEYTLPYCPINPNIPQEKKRGVGVLCSQFLIGDNILIPKNVTEYVEIDTFLKHVSIEFTNEEIKLSQDSYKEISQYF